MKCMLNALLSPFRVHLASHSEPLLHFFDSNMSAPSLAMNVFCPLQFHTGSERRFVHVETQFFP